MVRRELEQRVVEVAGERDSMREKVNNVEK
jgi:hypothetical protein